MKAAGKGTRGDKGANLAGGGGGDGGVAGGGGISRRISIGYVREAKWVEVDRAGRRRTPRREEERKRVREKEKGREIERRTLLLLQG